MSEVKPGTKAINRAMENGKVKSQVDICYDLASEIWMRINTLESDSKLPASRRMKKTERDRKLVEMSGIKLALRLALGVSYMPDYMNIDQFLNAFQQERLAHSRGQ